MRIILTLLLVAWACNATHAQVIEQYEPAILEVFYKKSSVQDTLMPETTSWDAQMLLRIGKNHSMYVPELKLWEDSLCFYNFNQYMEISMIEYSKKGPDFQFLGGIETEYLFKNMPLGCNTVYRPIGQNYYYYKETIEPQEWIYKDSTSIVLGYECHLAECNYRGRRWCAWYTLDIPISDGPWKLRGLPGLILEAYDSKRHYTFTATGMRQHNLASVGLYYYHKGKPKKVSRGEYLRLRHELQNSDIDPSAIYRNSGAYGLEPKKPEKPAKATRILYDYEEVDYQHTTTEKRRLE